MKISIPWFRIANYFLLASLATLWLKKPTMFPGNTNINDLFLLVSLGTLFLAYITHQIVIPKIRKSHVIWFCVGIGSILLGTLLSLIFFGGLGHDTPREYVRIFAALGIFIACWIIGSHDEKFAMRALWAIALPTILIPFIVYAPSSILPWFIDESGTRLTAFYYDPNYFANFQVLPAILWLWFTVSFIEQGKKFLWVLPFALFSYSVSAILWTSSRGGILGLLAGLALIAGIIVYRLPWKKSIFYIFLIMAGCVMSYLVLSPAAKQQIIKRASGLVTTTVDNKTAIAITANQGRGGIWKNAAIEALKNPLGFGPGYGNIANIHGDGIDHRVAHNTILQAALTGGIALLSSLAVGLWFLTRHIYQRGLSGTKPSTYLFVALAAVLVGSLFIDSLWSRWTWAIIALILVFVGRRE